MNRLSDKLRCLLLAALCNGVSLRSCERIFGVELKTVQKLLRDAGDWAIAHQATAPSFVCEIIQVDELWSFVGKNERRNALAPADERGLGVVWLFLAIEKRSRLVLGYHLGNRQAVEAVKFFHKIDARMLKDDKGDFSTMPTIVFDGWPGYPDAADKVFGNRVRLGACSKLPDKVGPDGEPLPGARFAGAKRILVKNAPDLGNHDLAHRAREWLF